MNFIQAVQHLIEGDCEAIARAEWEGKLELANYCNNLRCYSQVNDESRLSSTFNFTPETYVAEDWELVRPVLKAVSTKYTTYLVIDNKGNALSSFLSKEDAQFTWASNLCNGSLKLVPSVAIVDGVKPVKLRHRKEIPAADISTPYFISEDVKFFAEWQE